MLAFGRDFCVHDERTISVREGDVSIYIYFCVQPSWEAETSFFCWQALFTFLPRNEHEHKQQCLFRPVKQLFISTISWQRREEGEDPTMLKAFTGIDSWSIKSLFAKCHPSLERCHCLSLYFYVCVCVCVCVCVLAFVLWQALYRRLPTLAATRSPVLYATRIFINLNRSRTQAKGKRRRNGKFEVVWRHIPMPAALPGSVFRSFTQSRLFEIFFRPCCPPARKDWTEVDASCSLYRTLCPAMICVKPFAVSSFATFPSRPPLPFSLLLAHAWTSSFSTLCKWGDTIIRPGCSTHSGLGGDAHG